MFFNDGMSIWILAVLLIVGVALAGWRQGAVRAAISSVGILFAVLLAGVAGKIFHPLLPHLGVSNPVLAWALSPVMGFILVSAVFKVIARQVHRKVEHYYKYDAGDLRLALWTRLNSRLGICVGLLNGALYFVLVTFFIFNLTYWTTQVAAAPEQPLAIRVLNTLGNDLQETHLTRTASAVATLPPEFYQFADLSGFLMQNPQVGPRLADYPALTSLWERGDFLALVQDSTVTNALASSATLGELLNDPNVRAFLENKDQTKLVSGILEANLADLTNYLQTGKSPKYAGEKIIGRWEFNPAVTVAWMRQRHPKIPASEMRSVRAWMTQAYANTRLLATGDKQIFVTSLPHLKVTPGQPPATEQNDWQGDWSDTSNGTNYDVHLTFNGQDKFWTATANDDLRLTIKDGKDLLIFDKAD
jgi:uncharacterized membrane protein required for colicin V production